MKKVMFLILMSTLFSCGVTKRSSTLIQEDQLFVTRKYIGVFIDYCHTGPQITGGKDLIWIKTSVYNSFGKLSAYGKSCDFSVGDKIYLKPSDFTPDKFGYWMYQIENDSSISYRVSDFRFENNSFTQARAL